MPLSQMSIMKKILSLILCFICLESTAQKDPIEKVWYNGTKTSKIEIYKTSDGHFYGMIVWLKEPHDAAGKPRVDKNNKDVKEQAKPLMGLLVLKRFKKNAAGNEYEGGNIYDPNNGKTYCGTITLKGKELKLKGNICGWGLLSRSTTWTLAE
jgi:uncharacterized protein (DUF2147 family)